uniref:Secreted frizzled-related protein 2-like n=1 Tax=Geotrypetes seraphini TaxID=260995 RepID=A0A6P8SC15_GEOSA|nr:secreted frizzled-related protein 2-like [Geotrypetes seraphini]
MLPAPTFVFAAGCLLGLTRGLDIGLSTKCVVIPKELGMCHGIGYAEMRLPNLMGHTSLAEVVSKAADWAHLLQTGCHPFARTFLCALFAPVCLDTFIQPCRSVCLAVRRSCAPVLACLGHSWPASLNCERIPAGEDMCLAPLSKEEEYIYKELPKPTCQGCPTVEDAFSYTAVLEAFCDSNFALKAKLVKRKAASGEPEYNIEGQVEFINQGLLLPYDTRNLIQQWLLINESCAQRMTRSNRSMVYIMVGDVKQGTVFISRLYHWQRRDSQLILATRKWRHHKC